MPRDLYRPVQIPRPADTAWHRIRTVPGSIPDIRKQTVPGLEMTRLRRAVGHGRLQYHIPSLGQDDSRPMVCTAEEVPVSAVRLPCRYHRRVQKHGATRENPENQETECSPGIKRQSILKFPRLQKQDPEQDFEGTRNRVAPCASAMLCHNLPAHQTQLYAAT